MKSVIQDPQRGRLILERKIKGTLDLWKILEIGRCSHQDINKQNLKFAGNELKAGVYAMYAVPHKDYWEITLNSKINSSGYERPDPSFDVFTVSIPVNTTSNSVEQFSISLKDSFSNVSLTMEWDQLVAVIPIVIRWALEAKVYSLCRVSDAGEFGVMFCYPGVRSQ